MSLSRRVVFLLFWRFILELIKGLGEAVTNFLDAFDADGEKIPAGSITVTFPAN